MIKFAEVTGVYLIILMLVDYGCYYQATIFTTLDGSGRGMDSSFRNLPCHPLPHWSLRMLAVMGYIFFISGFAFNLGEQILPIIIAGLAGSYFFTRYLLMRKGIS